MNVARHYNLKKIFIVVFLLFGLASPVHLYSQSGGRKSEGGVKRKKSFRKQRSAGHADDFAKGGRRKGMFARLFRKDRPAWTYRSSGTTKSHWRDNKFLFSRHRQPGKVENSTYLDRQNAKRARKRSHGNENFKSKKYKTR